MEQPESNPRFCTNNCGFYGSSQFEGMCSKCYRSCNAGGTNSCHYPSSNTTMTSQNLLEDNTTSVIEKDNSDEQPIHASHLEHAVTPTIKNESPVEAASTLTTAPVDSPTAEKKKRNRCSWETCNKKLGLTGFDCRCGGQFCSLHRYANEHNCTFDYKEHGQNEIRKNMPVVQADRVQRI